MKNFTKLMALVLVFLCGTMMQTNATELVVADGTATNSRFPINGYWGDAVCHHQMIYPASMLQEMAGGTISNIVFHVASPASIELTAIYKVSVAIVSEAAFASKDNFISAELTQVYEGKLDASKTTVEVAFNAPFAYAGGNLLIDVQTKQSGSYKDAYFYGISTDYIQAIIETNIMAGDNFLPKATFTFEGVTISCPKPSDLAVQGAPESSAVTLAWTNGGTEEAWNIYYRQVGVEDWTVVENVKSNPYKLQGLTPVTSYEAQVTAACAADDESFVSNSVTFKTVCGAYALPWSENFESATGGTLPACWSKHPEDAHVSVASYGAKELCFNMPAGISGAALLPPFDAAIADLTIEFEYRMVGDYNEGIGNASLEVGFMSIVGEDSIFGTSKVFEKAGSKTAAKVNLKDASSEAVAIVLRVNAVENAIVYIDNITVSLTPDCPTPTDVEASELTYNSATFVWEQGEDENLYEWACVPAGDVVVTWNVLEADVRTASVDGLVAGVEYEFVVRSSCGAGKYGEEVRLSFSPVCPIANGVAVNSISDESAVVTWEQGEVATAWTVKYTDGYDELTIDVTEPKCTLTDLWQDTEYQVFVKTLSPCEGEYTAAVSFRTACAALSLPFKEDFESVTTTVPDCWSAVLANEYSGVVSGAAAFGEEGKCFEFYGIETQLLVLPAVNVVMSELTLSLYYKTNNEAVITIGYLANDEAFHALKALEVLSAYGEEPVLVDLKDAPTAAKRIAIQYSDAASTLASGFVDEIEVLKTSEIITGIEAITGNEKAGKHLENGKLIIIHDGKRYNAIGTEVE